MKTDKLLNYLFYFSVMLFFIGFNFRDNPQGGWQLQTMPDLNGAIIKDIYFIDSLIGYAVTGNDLPNDSSGFILKTINGGDNWIIKFTDFRDYSRVIFINSTTGFVSGGYNTGARLMRTTNSGEIWNSIANPGGGGLIYINDMSVINSDTMWIVSSHQLIGGVFRTTNGGLTWTQQYAAGNQNPDKIYMYNARIGFIVKNDVATRYLRKTTNGGENWFVIMNEGFNDMHFIDSLTGWKCWSTLTIKKTTDGGYNWITYNLPPETGGIGISMIQNLHLINPDTIWGVGAFTNKAKALIYLTTNGGVSWGYQLPDTNQISIYKYYFIQFYNKLKGWAYSLGSGVHTTTGGDTTIYTSVGKISNEVPMDYILGQNYPNPFNSSTNVKFQMLNSGYVEIKVFDISGKMLNIITNKKYNAGEYTIVFDAGDLPSGIYFYSLNVDGKVMDTKKAILIK